MGKVLVHDRIGVQGQKVLIDESTLIDIPAEFDEDMGKIRQYQEDLNNARVELGRLMQVVSQLTYACNVSEKNLADSKKRILEALNINEGNWAIDFEDKKIGRVINDERKPHTVV